MELHNNIATLYIDLGDCDSAEKHAIKAITLKADSVEGHYNMGNILVKRGLACEGIGYFKKALKLDPSFADAHSSIIFAQDAVLEFSQKERQEERKRWNDSYVIPNSYTIAGYENEKGNDRILRIGYVSADFYRQTGEHAFASLILKHNASKFEVYCYSGNRKNDVLTTAFKKASTQWCETHDLSDEAMVQKIRQDKIDILVDLSGHSKGNRLGVFARKPAPIQVTGEGHNAPGLSTIDYRLTTKESTPTSEEERYPEKAVYLTSDAESYLQFREDVEVAYRMMWEQYCRGESAFTIDTLQIGRKGKYASS